MFTKKSTLYGNVEGSKTKNTQQIHSTTDPFETTNFPPNAKGGNYNLESPATYMYVPTFGQTMR